MTTEKEWWFDDLLPAFSEDYAPDKPFLKECIKRIVQEQKKRDWEEFRGMICHLRFVTSTENESEEVAKQVMDKALEYYKEKIADMIDSKIKEL